MKIVINQQKPCVIYIGGPDVNARIPLMDTLRDDYVLLAAGSSERIARDFEKADYVYFIYPMARRVNVTKDLYMLYKLWRLLRRVKPDVVHTFDTKPCVYGRLAARLAGVPIIIGTLPGLGTLYADERLFTRLLRVLYEPLQHLANYASTRTIFQNHDDRQELIGQHLIRAEKTLVIHGSGVPLERFDPTLRNECGRIRAGLGISHDALVVTMVGRVIRAKGVLEFAEAARMLREEFENVVFMLVGGVDEGDPLDENEMALLEQHLLMTGTRQDIPELLAASDIFALPSFYREGVPRVLIEAAAMGLPLVTTDLPGCRDTVEEGENGYLIPPQQAEALVDALRKLLVDADKRKQFGKFSRQMVETRFDLTIIAAQHRDLYDTLLRNQKAAVGRSNTRFIKRR